jgi:hypothetical protein
LVEIVANGGIKLPIFIPEYPESKNPLLFRPQTTDDGQKRPKKGENYASVFITKNLELPNKKYSRAHKDKGHHALPKKRSEMGVHMQPGDVGRLRSTVSTIKFHKDSEKVLLFDKIPGAHYKQFDIEHSSMVIP